MHDIPAELAPELLRLAYQQGYFPMPHPQTGEILWFHPDPRAVLPLSSFHTSRSLHRTLRRTPFTSTINQAFEQVIQACSEHKETWLDARFKAAYTQLHKEGDAHSLEIWLQGELVGGVYGVSIQGAFFAESMFHRVTDASKVALLRLTEYMQKQGMQLLEVQFMTPHLASLGVIEIPRYRYMQLLQQALQIEACFIGHE